MERNPTTEAFGVPRVDYAKRWFKPRELSVNRTIRLPEETYGDGVQCREVVDCLKRVDGRETSLPFNRQEHEIETRPHLRERRKFAHVS